MLNLEKTCLQVCEIAKKAGSFIQNEKQNIGSKDVEVKGLHDFVTYVDKSAEKLIVNELKGIIPDAGFITEEKTITIASDQYNWIIDPLDGTTNYIHGIPCYSVSIALQYHSELVLGVVYEINLDECFYSWKGGAAFLNGAEIKVSACGHLEDSLLATGFPYYDFSKIDQYMELFKLFMMQTRGVRRLGSAAVDLAYVACGRFEGFYEYSLNPWDVAAGAFIVKQAGGSVCDFKGGENYLFGKEIIASNEGIFGEFKEAVKKFIH